MHSVALAGFSYAPDTRITKKHILACAFNTCNPVSTALRLNTDESDGRSTKNVLDSLLGVGA